MAYGGEAMSANTGNNDDGYPGRWRIAAWVGAGLLLLLPLAAMQVTEAVDWSVADFVVAGVLLFVPLGLYELVARRTGDSAYRTGTALALVGSVLIVWVSGAVGITDSDADVLYVLALAIGAIGAVVARFRPAGMARAMFATALALAAAGVIALVAGMVPAYNSAFEILGLTGFFAALFAGSAMLFREAARNSSEADVT